MTTNNGTISEAVTNAGLLLVTQALEFQIPIPASVNNAYEGVNRRLSKSARAFKDAAGWLARVAASEAGWQYAHGVRLKCSYVFYFASDRQRRDLSNCLKLAEDAIANALHFDDNWLIVSEVHLYAGGVDKQDPRCEVRIETIEVFHGSA